MDFGCWWRASSSDHDVGARGAKLFGWFGGYGISGTGQFFESIGFRPGRVWPLPQGSARWRAACSWPSVSWDLSVRADALSDDRGEQPPLEEWVVGDGQRHRLPLLYSAAAVALAFTGYGTYSLDGLFGLARCGRRT
jgi:putative oxidoreductase